MLSIKELRTGDPFRLLGLHANGNQWTYTTFAPHAENVYLDKHQVPRIEGTDFFQSHLNSPITLPLQLSYSTKSDSQYEVVDPYSFLPVLSDLDLHLINNGTQYPLYEKLGANLIEHQGYEGTLFAVWAPSARSVSVIGGFNDWNGNRHPMRPRGSSGVWEIFIPNISEGNLYKFEIITQEGHCLTKLDPMAKSSEIRPKQGNVISKSTYEWTDNSWNEKLSNSNIDELPMSVYEVHLGSWKRPEDGSEFLSYKSLKEQLIPWVVEHGFTHIELLPVAEHPLDESWGYQVTGYYAVNSRHGSVDEFKDFVNECHLNDIGVILDWVPAHFPKDAVALGRFDGTALYEHSDPRQGEHPHWGTYIFNYGRNEVSNFLISNAIYWLKEFHIDGLRVDAVASMLYLDYGKEDGEWVPSEFGDNINRDAIEFFKHLSSIVRQEHPNKLLIAEESTSFANITKAPEDDGLGFHYKWNMGWMNDFLSYMEKEPIHRQFHHNLLTFSLYYAYSEKFVLVLSHDEVVHGKGSLLEKMPGDDWQKFANLRLLLAFMFTHPGKKLLFMGSELAQRAEWNSKSQLSWEHEDHQSHKQVGEMLTTLNQLYTSNSELYEVDHSHEGFQWIDCEDASQSIVAYIRIDKAGNQVLTVCNFTPVPRQEHRIGLPSAGKWIEIFNSDSTSWGGSDVINSQEIQSEEVPWHHRDQSAIIKVPPLGATILKRVK